MRRYRSPGTWILAVALLAPAGAAAQPAAFVADTEETDDLYGLDLATGTATFIGGTVAADVEGLALRGDGVLFGISDDSDELLTCDPLTGACSAVGTLGAAISDPGLAFACDGTLFMGTEGGNDPDAPPGDLYRVDTTTGLATLVGSLLGDFDAQSIAQGPASPGCPSGMYALDGNHNADEPRLACLDLTTGAATVIGDTGVAIDGQPAVDFDAGGTLWLVENLDGSDIYTVDLLTGAATDVGDVAPASTGFDAFAMRDGFVCPAAPAEVIPVADGLGLAGLAALLGLAGVFALRHLRA
jgi:hypothetical protein